MFSLASGFLEQYVSPVPLTILVLGHKSVGKTSLLERIKVTEFRARTTNNNNKKNPSLNRTSASTCHDDSHTKRKDHHHHPGGTLSNTQATTAGTNDDSRQTDSTTTTAAATSSKSKRRHLACPTPFSGNKYQHDAVADQQDEDEYCSVLVVEKQQQQQQQEDATSGATAETWTRQKELDPLYGGGDTRTTPPTSNESWAPSPPSPPPPLDQEAFDVRRTSSLEDVAIQDQEEPHMTPQEQAQDNTCSASLEEPLEEFDLRRGAKMLPLDKIRPTLGMNMAKRVRIGQCTCKVLDVGGSMQELWPQYYGDADAVVYVVGYNDAAAAAGGNVASQRDTLEQVRWQIPDDVPLLVFVHDLRHFYDCDALPPTLEELLPHYHNNVMECFVGSAKTGEGVRDAFDWLVGVSKRQWQLRNTKV